MGYRRCPTVATHLPVGGQPQLAELAGSVQSQATAPADTPHAGHEPEVSGSPGSEVFSDFYVADSLCAND